MARIKISPSLSPHVHPRNLLFRIGVCHHDSLKGIPSQASREPLSRSVWLTETKIRRRYFSVLHPVINAKGRGGEGCRPRGWLNSVRASTDKRQTPSSSSSFVCFKRHLFDGLDGLARGFSRLRGGKKRVCGVFGEVEEGEEDAG